MPKTPIPPTQPLQFRSPLKDRYKAIIAIPCCNELETLPKTLKSLEKCNPADIAKTLIIVNVNQRAVCSKAFKRPSMSITPDLEPADLEPADLEQTDNCSQSNNALTIQQANLETLEWLRGFETTLQLAWLDHASEKNAYPEKFGVGLARHQACSVGLSFIDDDSPVISLDADSPVNAEYLEAIFSYIAENPNFKAGHVNFQHRHCGGKDEERAIGLYEEHLKRHRRLLEKAGSPHAWYAIGSTIVCTKSAYLKAGGYHCRKMAGEDFYLLQQLSKTGCKIEMIKEAFVYPSDRVSDRVPFGTGKAVGDIIADGKWLTYHEYCYRDLGQLLEAVDQNLDGSADTIFEAVPKSCQAWLAERKFADVWPKLQSNATSDQMLLRRFHEWLDAFQTLKLIHHLSDNHYPRVELT